MKKLLLLLSLFAFNAIAAPVNVNTADAKTIADALSGIGMKKAEAIVKYRTEKGLFKTPEDLTQVKGIGKKTVEKNKKDILLSDTPAGAPSAVAEPKATAEPKAVAEPKTAAEPKKDNKPK
jgi:competence protein ComEA